MRDCLHMGRIDIAGDWRGGRGKAKTFDKQDIRDRQQFIKTNCTLRYFVMREAIFLECGAATTGRGFMTLVLTSQRDTPQKLNIRVRQDMVFSQGTSPDITPAPIWKSVFNMLASNARRCYGRIGAGHLLNLAQPWREKNESLWNYDHATLEPRLHSNANSVLNRTKGM